MTAAQQDEVVAFAERALHTVEETVARCYRIQDRYPDARYRPEFDSGRWHGYAQTLALLLDRKTRDVERALLAREL